METIGFFQIVIGLIGLFWPVWIAMAITLFLSFYFQKAAWSLWPDAR